MSENNDPRNLDNTPTGNQAPQADNDGFGDGSPVVRPWVLALMVFALLAGITASAVMNASERAQASREEKTSSCRFAGAASKAGMACPFRARAASSESGAWAAKAAETDAVAEYEASLKAVDPVQPDLEAGGAVTLAAQAADAEGEAVKEEKSCSSGEKKSGCAEKAEKQGCGAAKSCGGAAKSGSGKSCPATGASPSCAGKSSGSQT